MSEMGSLSGCILENDPQTVGRARLLRGKALAASIGLEATVNPGPAGLATALAGHIRREINCYAAASLPRRRGRSRTARRTSIPGEKRDAASLPFLLESNSPYAPEQFRSRWGDDERWRSGSWPRTWQRYRRAHNSGSRRRWTVTD